MIVHLFKTQFTEYFKPSVEIYCSEKKKKFQNITEHFDDETGNPRAPMEMYSEIHIVSNPVNTSMLQPMDQKVILIFKCYYIYIFFFSSAIIYIFFF